MPSDRDWGYVLGTLAWATLVSGIIVALILAAYNAGQMAEKETICHQLRVQAPSLPVGALEGGPCRIASDR